MNSCREFEPWLSLYANAELEAGQAGALEKHLAGCANCRREVASYQQLSQQMAQLQPPAIPENVFSDFHAGVAGKITRGESWRMRVVALIAVIASFYSRRRTVVWTVFVGLILAGVFTTNYFERATAPVRPTLAELLQNRDWPGLYYELSSPLARATRLHEPVPAGLLLAVLHELREAAGQDRRLRAGLEQILSQVPSLKHKATGGAQSANRIGVIAADGVRILKRNNSSSAGMAPVERSLSQIPPHKEITLNELIAQIK